MSRVDAALSECASGDEALTADVVLVETVLKCCDFEGDGDGRREGTVLGLSRARSRASPNVSSYDNIDSRENSSCQDDDVMLCSTQDALSEAPAFRRNVSRFTEQFRVSAINVLHSS